MDDDFFKNIGDELKEFDVDIEPRSKEPMPETLPEKIVEAPPPAPVPVETIILNELTTIEATSTSTEKTKNPESVDVEEINTKLKEITEQSQAALEELRNQSVKIVDNAKEQSETVIENARATFSVLSKSSAMAESQAHTMASPIMDLETPEIEKVQEESRGTRELESSEDDEEDEAGSPLRSLADTILSYIP